MHAPIHASPCANPGMPAPAHQCALVNLASLTLGFAETTYIHSQLVHNWFSDRSGCIPPIGFRGQIRVASYTFDSSGVRHGDLPLDCRDQFIRVLSQSIIGEPPRGCIFVLSLMGE